MYLNVATPACAAYKEEWVSDREVHQYASSHPDNHPKRLLKDHPDQKRAIAPKSGTDPIAAFAGRPVDSKPHVSSTGTTRHAGPRDARVEPKARTPRKLTMVSR
ncbi:hypothetical protein C5O80_36870 [Burkholderia sp. SRS-46]|nr:hypothetical protein C5O80_36870 [Burkholderia sp. SRS-46]